MGDGGILQFTAEKQFLIFNPKPKLMLVEKRNVHGFVWEHALYVMFLFLREKRMIFN